MWSRRVWHLGFGSCGNRSGQCQGLWKYIDASSPQVKMKASPPARITAKTRAKPKGRVFVTLPNSRVLAICLIAPAASAVVLWKLRTSSQNTTGQENAKKLTGQDHPWNKTGQNNPKRNSAPCTQKAAYYSENTPEREYLVVVSMTLKSL
jgi:hypothetical protein